MLPQQKVPFTQQSGRQGLAGASAGAFGSFGKASETAVSLEVCVGPSEVTMSIEYVAADDSGDSLADGEMPGAHSLTGFLQQPSVTSTQANGSLEPFGVQNEPQQNVSDGQQLIWQFSPAFKD
jgi:hypothetical protein